MVGSEGLSQRLKEDRISQLPDPLICQILSHLRTKDSVKTSVLSTRWKTLWLWVPNLDLHARIPEDFPDLDAFVTFGGKFFNSDRVSCMREIQLRIDETAKDLDDAPYFTSWIDAAIKRKVQHLDVYCPPYVLIYGIPISLYSCETLVILKLHEVVLPNAPEFVSLPCLKTLHLIYVWFPSDATFERFVSCCPVLEELEIFGCGDALKVMRVHSLSLKSLKLELYNNKAQVVIDAPLLCCLKINDQETESYIITNLGDNAKLDIYLTFGLQYFDEARVSSMRSNIRRFLTGISKVREMNINKYTLELICQYSKLEPLPQFGYMYRLFADIDVPDLKWLLPFLGSCPNLNSLILIWDGDAEEMNQMSFSYVPECLVSSLKYVHIITRVSGYDGEMKLVRYLLENSVILKKLTLRLDYNENVNDIFKKLLKIPRRSITCQVVVC